jgi:threonine aldolase
MPTNYHFASDNCAGVHPDVMNALAAANHDHMLSYGDDAITASAVSRFRALLGDVDVFFVFNGTGANITGLAAMLAPFQAVVCAETAHIACDECGAPEKFCGCKLITLPQRDGKITPAQISPLLEQLGVPHHVQPHVVSITQATELGTVYSPAETRALADFAHAHGLLLHMDGARICNAAAALGLPLSAITGAAGVDVLSFGGAKNGLMFGEAVVFFNRDLARNYQFIRKQSAQLTSKMRFISAQFDRLLADELWLKNARHANAMAALLAEKLAAVPGVALARPVEANAVFARLPCPIIAPLQEQFYFYVWEEITCEIRLMCSFDTTEEIINDFFHALQLLINS